MVLHVVAAGWDELLFCQIMASASFQTYGFFLFIDTGLLTSLVNWCTYTTYQPPTKVAANNVHVEDNPTGILYICEVELNHAQL
jgi:hypothetical protein